MIDKSMISEPLCDSFKHISHMGYDAEKGFTSSGVGDSWQQWLEACVNTHGTGPTFIWISSNNGFRIQFK